MKPTVCTGTCKKYNSHCGECSHAFFTGKKNGYRWTFRPLFNVELEKKNSKGRYEVIEDTETTDYEVAYIYFSEWYVTKFNKEVQNETTKLRSTEKTVR